ncbi:MAG: hypothetical protein WA463_02310 [Terriglobales bacterium]
MPASPALALSIHHPLLLGPPRFFAYSIVPGDMLAMVPGAEGAATLTAIDCCTAVLPRVTVKVPHVTPGGKAAARQLTVTCPVNPPVGVIVTVVFADPPAVTVRDEAVATGAGLACVTVNRIGAVVGEEA